jgi:hypothetical protein
MLRTVSSVTTAATLLDVARRATSEAASVASAEIALGSTLTAGFAVNGCSLIAPGIIVEAAFASAITNAKASACFPCSEREDTIFIALASESGCPFPSDDVVTLCISRLMVSASKLLP